MQQLPPINWVDIVIVIIVLLGTLRGYGRRLSGELAFLVSAVVGLAAAWLCHGLLADWVQENTDVSPLAAQFAAFLATALAAIVVMTAVAWLVHRLVRFILPPAVDRIAGALAGLVMSSALVLLTMMLLNLWPNPALNRVCGEESLAGRLIVEHILAPRRSGAADPQTNPRDAVEPPPDRRDLVRIAPPRAAGAVTGGTARPPRNRPWPGKPA